MFKRKILHDLDWSSSDDEKNNVHFAKSTMEHSPLITQHTQLPKTWSPPDPCLTQREYSEDEHDIVNFANITQQESGGELDRSSFIDDRAIESDLSPTLLELNSPISLSTNTSTQIQSIHQPGPSKFNKKGAKRTLELISDDESINLERIKKWRVVKIDSYSKENYIF